MLCRFKVGRKWLRSQLCVSGTGGSIAKITEKTFASDMVGERQRVLR